MGSERESEREREREREGHGKNHRGFMMSEPSCERAFPLTGKEILLQSVSLLTPVCNRHKHEPTRAPSLSLRRSASALSLNLLVMMQLVGSGESRRKEREREKKNEEKKRNTSSPPEPSGIPGLWKNCALVVFSSSSREHSFQEAQGVKHTQFGADLSPLISLA